MASGTAPGTEPHESRRGAPRLLRLPELNSKVVLVQGAGQVGRRTMLRHMRPDLLAVVFDPVIAAPDSALTSTINRVLTKWYLKHLRGRCMSGFTMVVAVAMALSGSGAGWPDLSQPGVAVGGGEKDAAVIVAVEDYPFLPKVEGAVAVGSAWFSYLEGSRKVPFVLTKFNRDATRLQILKAVEDAAGQVKKGGRLWVVFIGHGAASKDGSDLRDTEQVPLLEEGGIEAFIRREVLPYTPDAWIEG